MTDFSRKQRILAVLLTLLAGGLLRAGHLVAPHVDSDQAIFGLQGLHVLRGEFPVFSWGYAYIGTLQTYIDAVFFSLFGASRIVLNAVPLLFYAGYGAGLYLLAARMFPGFFLPWLGLLLGAVAPEFFMLHGAWGRHGYPETFCFGSLILGWAAFRLDRPARFLHLFGIFFLAGLAFWTNFLVIYYFAPLGLFWLFRLLRAENARTRARVVLASFSGFVFGSAPLWVYNFRHGFASFTLFESPPAGGDLAGGLAMALREFFPVLVGAMEYGTGNKVPVLHAVLTSLLAAAFLFFLVCGALGFLSRVVRGRLASADLAWSFFAALLLVYFKSRYAVDGDRSAIRYLVPFYSVYPLVPVYLLYHLERRGLPRRATLIVAGFLVFMNAASTYFGNPLFQERLRRKYRSEMRAEHELFEALRPAGNETYLMYDYWKAARFTFDSGENPVFAHVNSRYPPYLHRAFARPSLNYLTGGRDASFERGVRLLGFDFREETVCGYRRYHGFRPLTPTHLSVIAPGNIRLAASCHRHRTAAALDANAHTELLLCPAPDRSHLIEVRFDRPRAVAGLAFVLRDRFRCPGVFRVMDPQTGDVLADARDFYPGYAAGTHPFLPGSPPWMEIRFPDEKRTGLAIHFKKALPEGVCVPLSEILFFEAVPPPADPDNTFSFLEKHSGEFERVFCSPAAVDGVSRVTKKPVLSHFDKSLPVSFREKNAFVMETACLDVSMRLLERFGIPFRAFRGGVFSCVLAETHPWKKAEWSLKALFTFHDRGKAKAAFARARGASSLEDAIRELEKALFYYPDHYFAALLLSDAYREAGREKDRKRLSNWIAARGPETPLSVRFDGDIRLGGLSLSSGEVSPGDTLAVLYHLVFEKHRENDFALFVHFRTPGGEVLFQNDHYLDAPFFRRSFIEGEAVHDRNWVVVPESSTYRGPVEIWFGAWDPEQKKRFKPETNLPSEHRAVKIGEIRLIPPGEKTRHKKERLA